MQIATSTPATCGDLRSHFARLKTALFGIDPRALAAFRIAIGAILLVDLAIRSADLTTMYVDDGVMSIDAARQFVGSYGWSLHFLDGSPAYQATLFAVAAALAAMLMCGWRTRAATVASWILLISLHARVPLVVNGGDVLLRMLLFWGMFLPLGRRWSVDARLARRASRGEQPRDSPTSDAPSAIVSMATLAILVQLCLMYWFSAAFKCNAYWLEGTALRYIFMMDAYIRPLGHELVEYPALLARLAWVTLALEAIGPALLFVPCRTGAVRVALAALFVTMHAAIELAMTVGLFSYIVAAAWLLLLPPTFWDWITSPRAAKPGVPRDVRRPAASKMSATDAAAGGPGRFARRASGVACLALFVYVLAWNVATLGKRFAWVMPPRLEWIGNVAMLQQKWNMFSTPGLADGWYVARARLRDGSIVDLLRDGTPISERPASGVKPADVSSMFQNHRWRKFYINLTFAANEPYRAPTAEFLARDWNRRHGDDRQGSRRIVALDLYYFRQPILLDEPSPEVRRELFAHVSLGSREETGNFAESLKALERADSPP